jgi:hypothetical protein
VTKPPFGQSLRKGGADLHHSAVLPFVCSFSWLHLLQFIKTLDTYDVRDLSGVFYEVKQEDLTQRTRLLFVCRFLIEFGIAVFPKTLHSACDFNGNRYNESRNLLKGENTFLFTIPTFIVRCVCECVCVRECVRACVSE